MIAVGNPDKHYFSQVIRINISPDWCGSVGCPTSPVKQKVSGSIPGQGTGLGCRLGPWLGQVWKATIDVSPFFSFLFLKKKD